MNKPSGKDVLALVGNPEVYAVQNEDGTWTPVHERLTPAVVRKHRAGEVTVGTYIVLPPDQARTLVFDIDHADEREAEGMLNKLTKHLGTLGLDYLVEASGRKGYHVWVPTEYMPATTLYRLGRGVRAELGFDALEVFPKQTEVRKLGNLVKLPGGVHRVTGKPNDFIGPTAAYNLPESLEALAAAYPEVGVRSRTAAEGSVEYPCVAHIQDGVHEGGRNIHLFHLAVMLRKFSLADEHVEYIVRAANDKSDPPLEETELLQILENSQFSGPVCGQLGDDAHCGEQCMLTRHAGLYTRAGALKFAQDEENVVVTVESRSEEGRLVELSHPDMVQGRATLSEPKRRKSDG